MVTTPPRKSKIPNILGDWDDVRFFLAVAKTGSFSAAASQLNTKQTTVGRRIQALERRLGAKLFDRHRHGMEVTPAARGVLVQAESMLSNATSIERHLAGLDREMSGVVRVAATEGLAAQWLVPRLTELRRRHSDIVVQVIVGDQVLDLATRQADLAIRFFRPTSNQLVAARVGQFNMSIFAAPPYIEQFGLPQEIDDLRELRTNSSHSAMEAVKAAWGMSIFPSYSSKTANIVEAPINLNIVRDIWLVSHEETNKGARIRAVIDYIREQFRQDERDWFSIAPPGKSMAAA